MKKPLNPDWPLPDVRSVDEMMTIAVAMEAEAAYRYDQLARRVERQRQPELAQLFERLAQLEREHLHGLEAWAGREGRRHPTPAQIGWQMPETFGDDSDLRPLDPYLALAVAVRNEERAFVFYSYLAALCAGDAGLRARAEALAREELKHVAMLRAMRRRAFHDRVRPAPVQVGTLADLRRVAGGFAAGTAELDGLLGIQGSARPVVTDAPASPSVEKARRAGQLAPGALPAGAVLPLALADAQEVLDAYLTIADAAATQDVLGEAQELAQRAVARLAQLNRLKNTGARPMPRPGP